MKVIVIISVFCFLGGSYAAPSAYGLHDDFMDFAKLLPVDEIGKVVKDYVINDKEIQAIGAYFHGKEFAAIWNQVTKNKEFRNLVTYLDNAGFKVIEALNKFADALKLPPYSPQMYSDATLYRTGSGLNGLLDDIKALFPREKLRALFREKLETSPEFKAFYDKLSSAEFQKIVHFVKSSPEMTNALNLLKERGVDVNKIVEYVKAFFGWH